MPLIRKLSVMLALVICSALAHAQSLGEVARKNQEHLKSEPAQTVLTNDDLPKSGLADEDAQSPIEQRSSTNPHAASKAVSAQEGAARNFRLKILNQKAAVASLQARIAQMHESVHFAQSSVFYNSAQTNQRAQDRLDQAQALGQQLDDEKKKLEELQESARKAGFGTAVVDP